MEIKFSTYPWETTDERLSQHKIVMSALFGVHTYITDRQIN